MAGLLAAAASVPVITSPHVPLGEVWFIPSAPQRNDYKTDAEWAAALEQWARSLGRIVNAA